jgi:hypothetical protein
VDVGRIKRGGDLGRAQDRSLQPADGERVRGIRQAFGESPFYPIAVA